MKSYMASPATIERKWYVVDATGHTLGRLTSEIAKVLRGKNKPTFTPHIDTGDYVIVVNADKIKVTGKKMDQKIYYTLVGADSAVELAAPAAVGVPLTIVVAPHNTEGEHTLRLDHTAQQVDLLILGMSIDHRLQRGQHFLDGLDELGLIAVLGLHILQHASQISIHNNFLLKFLFFVENYLTTDAMFPSS